MKKAILPITLGLAGLGLTVWLFWWAFESQREDVAVARAFLTHIAAEEYDQAQTLLTPLLASRLSPTALDRQFGRIEPWERLRFGERSSNSSSDGRRTQIWGLGITVSGCESELFVRLQDGLIDEYNVTPLCPMIGEDV
ncbi:hypothetical protein [Gymnodinialimonas hymeniacidonis]|uniref:hypothetical protein n=1 Tax=Gymnodinialimonas hymeniacidonis TaxID=3126508 RepID=UPI0034C64932